MGAPSCADDGLLAALGLDPSAFELERPRDFVCVIRPQAHEAGDYLHEVLLREAHRESFFSLVDATGLVCCLGLRVDEAAYRKVRGRSSKGRLSQGEYYHHDGCSGPTKPRVVEIRCPMQVVPRRICTAGAPFPATVSAMLACLPAPLAAQVEGEAMPEHWTREQADQLQGALTRLVRRELSAEGARAYFRAVDARCGAYLAPWSMGESRFYANENPRQTVQHRRAYTAEHRQGAATGHLSKRWPAEEVPPLP